MAAILDAQGNTQQVPIAVDMYRAAADNGMTFSQFVNTQYPTNAERYGSSFEQLLASENIFLKSDPENGIRASTLDDVINGHGRMEAGTIVKDALPTSRILFPAAILTAIEDRLIPNLSITPDAFDSMVAIDDAINNDRFERPVLNYSGPSAARAQPIGQLALPTSMLSITVSEVTRKIPTFSLGVEISDQAVKATTLDLLSMAIARQAAVERNERANNYIYSLYAGDPDMGMASLSSISGKVLKASSFDATISASGALTQKAWMKYLFNNGTKRIITHVVTDMDGALAIENRTGKPVIVGDNPTSTRIDTLSQVVNAVWPNQVKVFITNDPNWPANTIMGIDTRWGIHRVKSLTAAYQAVEAFVLKRSTALRFDFGEIVYRLYDDAYDVLSLIP